MAGDGNGGDSVESPRCGIVGGLCCVSETGGQWRRSFMSGENRSSEAMDKIRVILAKKANWH